MKRSGILYIFFMMFILAAISSSASAASDLPLWDNAVNRLLAAGLYGVDLKGSAGTALRVEQSSQSFTGLFADKAGLSGQSITFSYEGSSGLLGFSAGYIYTSGANEGTMGSVYLGLDDPMGFQAVGSAKAWYLALDLSTSYQPYDSISLGLVGKTLLIDDPQNLRGGRMFSLFLHMPVSYKKYITITPELQWSRPLSQHQNASLDNSNRPSLSTNPKNTFYSGVSISFSY